MVKYLARDWVFELNTGTAALPAWVPVGGLNTWAPANTKTDVDDTTFDSNGTEEHKVASRGAGLTLEGFYEVDIATGDRDPGQEALIVLADAVGYDSVKPFRMSEPAGKTEFLVSANVNFGGGGVNANSAFSVTLLRSGAATFTPTP